MKSRRTAFQKWLSARVCTVECPGGRWVGSFSKLYTPISSTPTPSIWEDHCLKSLEKRPHLAAG